MISAFRSFSILVLMSIIFTSCVGKRKYIIAQSEMIQYKFQAAELKRHNELLKKNNEEITQECNDFKAKASQEREVLEAQLNNQTNELEDKDKALAARAKRLMTLEAQFKKQQEAVNRLKSTMTAALVNFNTEDLSVEVRNGKVYISLSDKLLFPSASAKLNREGQDAIGKVAGVLKKNMDINIEILGHTDTKPIRIKFADNWELSTARSLTIARLLTDEYQINGKRIVASGASQFRPVAENETEEGRSKNRRTEIILSPNLDKLMNLLDNPKS